MSFLFHGDGIVWLAVLSSGVFAYYYIPTYLQHIKDLAAVAEESPPPSAAKPQINLEASNSISLKTLETLYNGPSTDLQIAAQKLVVQKFTSDPNAYHALVTHIQSQDTIVRDRAVNTLDFLIFDVSERMLYFNTTVRFFGRKDTYKAIIEALVYLLEIHDYNPYTSHGISVSSLPRSPICPEVRPPIERTLLRILLALVCQNPRCLTANDLNEVQARILIRVGFLTNFVTRYPFPCTLPQYEHLGFVRKQLVDLLGRDRYGTDYPLMAELVQCCKSSVGLKQLVDAGLHAPSFEPSDVEMKGTDDDDDNTEEGQAFYAGHISESELVAEELEQNPEGLGLQGMANDTSLGLDDYLNENTTTDIDDEQDDALPPPIRDSRSDVRRRSHRQAIVIAEPGEPLSSSNIIQQATEDLG